VFRVCPAAPAVESGAEADSNRVAVVCPVALTADPAALVCFRQAIRRASNQVDLDQVDLDQVDSDQAAAVRLVCPVDREVDSGPVYSHPALSAGLDSADLVSPACSVVRGRASAFLDLGFPVCRVSRASQALVCPALVCLVLVCLERVCLELDGRCGEDFPGVPASAPENLADDGSADDAAVDDGSVDDSSADDSPSCHGIPDGSPTRSVVDDTNNVADDKGFPSRSNSRDCSMPASLPNSIPNRPIPMGGYPQSARRSRLPR